MVLDIAAGVLLASAIIVFFWFGAGLVVGSNKFTRGSAIAGWLIMALAVIGGVALVDWRLFR